MVDQGGAAAAPSGARQPATPTIAQVAIAQGQNVAHLRTLLEDLAKGVLDMYRVVGTHSQALKAADARIAALEIELGVEIDEEYAAEEGVEDNEQPAADDDHDDGAAGGDAEAAA